MALTKGSKPFSDIKRDSASLPPNLNSLIIKTKIGNEEIPVFYRKYSNVFVKACDEYNKDNVEKLEYIKEDHKPNSDSNAAFISNLISVFEKFIEDTSFSKKYRDETKGKSVGSSNRFGIFVDIFKNKEKNDGKESFLEKLSNATSCSNEAKDWILEYTTFDVENLKDSLNKYVLEKPAAYKDFESVVKANREEYEKKSEAEKTVAEAIRNSIEKSGKKMIVFTGAPGTGKTYSVEEYVKKMIKDNMNRKKFVQFHSSFDYTDFVEGLRPVRNKTGEMEFVRMDGIFKAFCREAVENEPAYKEYFDARNAVEEASSPSWGGSSGDENSDRLAEAENKLKAAKDVLKDAEKAFKADSTLYYFIIDEINRADLGRVFGELMYCFEKRGFEHTVQTQYSNLPTYGKDGRRIADDVFGDGFFVPANVVVIGTMNDIDRSVETFDFALRRRFDWVEIEANAVMRSSLESMKVSENGRPADITGKITDELVNAITEMNNVIAEKKYRLGKEFMIGPAYFKGYDGSENSRKDIWEHNIMPILREYMRGRNDADDLVIACGKAFLGEARYNEYYHSVEGSSNDN